MAGSRRRWWEIGEQGWPASHCSGIKNTLAAIDEFRALNSSSSLVWDHTLMITLLWPSAPSSFWQTEAKNNSKTFLELGLG